MTKNFHSLIMIFILLILASGNAQHYENSPFGFHPALVVKQGYPDNGYSDAQNIGVKWHRPGLYVFWFLIQPDINSDTLDFTTYDRMFGEVPTGINILANINAQGNIDEGYCLPKSYLPIDSLKYIRFVKRTVERYDGDGWKDMPNLTNPVKYWQIGNEPNCRKPGFADLQRMTYLAIKAADPEATVLMGGAAGFPDSYIANFDENYAPMLNQLTGNYIDVFDFHWYGTAEREYRLKDTSTGEDVYEHIRMVLTENGFTPDLPIWITEMGAYSGDPNDEFLGVFPYQSEKQQAADYIKRFIYPLSVGIQKIFPAFGLIEGFKHDNSYFDHTGLIYDGEQSGDPGLGIKKLAYYSYKLMTEKLEGSDWDKIHTIQNTENICIFKLTNNKKPIWIAWSDSGTGIISLNSLGLTSAKVTEAIPVYKNGEEIVQVNVQFSEMFKKYQATGSVILKDIPIFIEEATTIPPAESDDSPFGFLNAPQLDFYYNDLGVKWTRTSAQWGLIQPEGSIENGTYNWEPWEEHIRLPELQNMDLLITISFLGTPVENTGSYVPSVYPYNEENYLLFVENLVKRYKSLTKYFQVENEPKPDIADFAELQKMTYLKIKEICPECIVVMGGYGNGAGTLESFDNRISPILSELNGNYMDVFDIHWFGKKEDSNLLNPARLEEGKMTMDLVKQRLEQNNFQDTDIWITETGTYSGKPAKGTYEFQSETEQAASLIKRYISPLASGVKRIMWAWGVVESFQKDGGFFDYTGLIYDGADWVNGQYVYGKNIGYDLGEGVKKLGYYTYKLMTEKLADSVWEDTETLINGDEYIYVFRFHKNAKDEIYDVVWWDYENDPDYTKAQVKNVVLSIDDANSVRITQSVPDAVNGAELSTENYPDFFQTGILPVVDGSVTIVLGENPVFVERISNPTSIGQSTKASIPEDFKLEQNYPNPFNPTTTISYNLPKVEFVTISIYNSIGQFIETIVSENKNAGSHSVHWNAMGKGSGIYFYKFEAGEYSAIKKCMILK